MPFQADQISGTCFIGVWHYISTKIWVDVIVSGNTGRPELDHGKPFKYGATALLQVPFRHVI